MASTSNNSRPRKNQPNNQVADKDDAVIGTLTLAIPQLTEWRIVTNEAELAGVNLREFIAQLANQGDNKPVTLSINLMLSLGEG